MITLEIVITIIDLTEFILKIVYCNTLYWYDESKLLVYHFIYIFSFNTISIALTICIYYKYLKIKKNEESDDILEVRDHKQYKMIYIMQTLHIIIQCMNLIIYIGLGIVFIVDLFMYNLDSNSEDE